MVIGLIYVKPICNELARSIIIRNHYTHKWTICELALGVFCEGVQQEFIADDITLGTIVFGPTAGANVAKSISPLLNHENLWELKRLWLEDDLPKNSESRVIAQSIDYIKKHHSEIKCLVSYADPDAGHNGTIYQATNFIYQNIERPKNSSGYLFSFNEGKSWVHPRTMFNKYGTFSVEQLVEVMPKPFWVKELAVKHRYVYPIGNKKWKKQLVKSFNYNQSEYPKAETEPEYIKKYDA